MRLNNLPAALNTSQVFRLLVLYRWLSLIPPVLALLSAEGRASFPALSAFGVAAAANLLITLRPRQLNDRLRRTPAALLIDLLICATLAALTDGWNTPYYLYAFSPLLAAAFFFEVRGALLAALGLSGLWLIAGLWTTEPNFLRLVAELVGFFLIGGAFGYAAALLARLQASHVELDRAHRDLEVIHELTLSMQSAADVDEVAERVLAAVTGELRFDRAHLALVDQNEQVIASWRSRSRAGEPASNGPAAEWIRLPLTPASGPIAQCLLDGQTRLSLSNVRTPDERLNARLGPGAHHLIPMLVREHPVGVLLVEAAGPDERARVHSLQAIASQAAVAVGTTMLCIDRAQRLAIQDERLRIAQDIHDTTVQTLFGLHYALDACAKLLPDHPQQVKTELQDLSQLAETARAQLRQSILNLWPSEITAERFTADLRRYVRDHCRAEGLDLSVTVRGDFQRLSAGTRRGLYRIAQEAVANTARHAAASHAAVCLEVGPEEALLTVRDDGRGFDPDSALARERDREHFGLRGIQERAAALGGEAEFQSQPDAGSTVLVTVPVNGVGSHD